MRNKLSFIVKIVCALAVVATSTLVLTGCTYKTYNLLGVLESTDGKSGAVKKLIDFTDEDKEKYDSIMSFKDYSITLKKDDTFVITYTISSTEDEEIIYKRKGRFELDGKELKMYFKREDGTEKLENYQYIDGKIVYIVNDIYLVFA